MEKSSLKNKGKIDATMKAFMDGKRLIHVFTDKDVELKLLRESGFNLEADNGNSMHVQLIFDGYSIEHPEQEMWFKAFNYEVGMSNYIKLILEKSIDLTADYFLIHPLLGRVSVVKRYLLDEPEFVYTGDDLGATYTPENTRFRVWTPTARSVKVAIYETENTRECKEISLDRDVNGTWFKKVDGDLKDKYYTYKVQIGGKFSEAVDPYAKGVGTNGERGIIVDLSSTNPPGWESDSRPPFNNFTDAIIYEINVRDFTIAENSGVKNRGKFLGLTEKGTTGPDGVKTGLDHLVELGITHVQLLPISDFGTVDECKDCGYNWGYDQVNYNVPEGSYATNPSNVSRIVEFKQLVQALHKNGLRVIMDVVYNHTYRLLDSWFHLIVPYYYHRTDLAGNFTNGSGCGNETASERPMVRKFITDSLKYWVTEYRVDGFRFDLLGLHDIDTVKHFIQELRMIEPGIIIYGEPWIASTSALPGDKQCLKGSQRNNGFAVFNDNLRNAIKGDNDGDQQGFATGKWGLEHAIKKGVVGSIDYSNELFDFTSNPDESINYASAHDNLCLWDKINRSNHFNSEEERIKMDMLCNAIVLTCQGIPFIHGGEDILRTKHGVHNSYNAGDEINKFDWSRKSKYIDVFNYYRNLINLRKMHPAFRMTNPDDIQMNIQFFHTPENTVGFLIKNNANGDSWETIAVIYNPHWEGREIYLPEEGPWKVVANDNKVGEETLFVVPERNVYVARISMMVLYK